MDKDSPLIQIPHPLPAQKTFWNSKARHKAFIGGIGSGKTLGGCVEALMQPMGTYGAILAPTYRMLKDATMLTFFEKFGGMVREHSVSDKLSILEDGKTIFWRSADDPNSLRGPNLNWFWLDEADYMHEDVWNVMLGRIRRHPSNCFITTSPNGDQNWVYQKLYTPFKNGNPQYDVIQAKTAENVYLPTTYLENLKQSYTSEFARQELDGEFIGPIGRVMKKEWIQHVLTLPPDNISFVVGVDLAVGMKTSSDDRAIVVVGKCGTTYFVCDVIFGKWSFNETKDKIIQTAYNWNATKICVESVAYQEVMVQQLRSETLMNIAKVDPKGRNKLTRFLPVAGKYEYGFVKHVQNLPSEFVDQLCTFDGKDGRHDDMVDALIYAIDGHESSTFVYDI